MVGVYGIVAYGVTQRTPEIGVRSALGATPSGIVGGVVRHGAGLAGVGIAIGLWAAYPLSRFMQGILYDVAATDAVMYLEALCDRGSAERASRRRRGASYALHQRT